MVFGKENLAGVVHIPNDALDSSDVITKGNNVGLRVKFSKYLDAMRKQLGRRKHNPIAPNQADIVNWILWDSNSVAANATFAANYKFFTSPISSTKTKIDTNMEQVMRLADPQFMNVTHLCVGFNANITSQDIKAVLGSYYIEFWVGQKIYIEGPVRFFPEAGGLASGGAATTVAATTMETLNNGFPALSNMYDLRLPQGIGLGDRSADGLTGISILQGQNFKVEMNGTSFTTQNAGGAGVKVWVSLHGILSRSVQ